MQYNNLDELLKHIKNTAVPRTLAVAAAHDEHCLEAVARCKKERIINPLLIGDRNEIYRIIDKLGESVSDYEIVHEPDVDRAALAAVSLVRNNGADFLMKGKLNTANILRPILNKESGLVDRTSNTVLNQFNIMELPQYHKLLVNSDAAITANPTLEQKKGIIINCVRAMTSMGFDTPKVAVLAAVETVNPKMPETVDGLSLVEMNKRGEISDCIVEGPLSFDMAFSKVAAAAKGYSGVIAGNPDMVLWPNVLAGNIGLKALSRFAGAKSVSYTVGATVPLVITSRGASAENKYKCILAAASAINSKN